jgi:hypothetical protein
MAIEERRLDCFVAALLAMTTPSVGVDASLPAKASIDAILRALSVP